MAVSCVRFFLALCCCGVTSGALYAAGTVTRHYGTEQGLAHDHVRFVTQDSRGYIWFATWSDVDRFDGYEFRNYRSFAGDSVKLDNNRIERVVEDERGAMWVVTYTRRVYGLDPLTGRFSVASAEDSAKAVALDPPANRPRAELRDYDVNSPLSFVDRDGNLWIVRRTAGVDYVTASPRAFRFVESSPLAPIGEEIHALHAAPDGVLWAASRDKRVMLYEPDGEWVGNLSATGEIRRDSTLSSGLMVYAVYTDRAGRVWLGTKQQELAVLDPRPGGGYGIERYRQDAAKGGLRCADVYDFAEDADGDMWLATFGGGVARAVRKAGGGMSFEFPKRYPLEQAARVRRLDRMRNGMMVGATTQGVVSFTPASQADSIAFKVFSSHFSDACSLSNNDILGVLEADDGSLYFSAYSGGIDRLPSAAGLIDGTARFENRSIRNGLEADPVLSVLEDAGGDFWVVSHNSISRYGSGWKHIATYNAGNIGHELFLTEAEPQILPGGRLAFGARGGILFIDPGLIGREEMPPLTVTEVETGGGRLFGLPAGNTIKLSRDSRDVAVHFAALDYASAGNIRYAYRLGDGDEWIPLGHERVVRLSGLPSGTSRLLIRWTDPYGSWTDAPLEIAIEAPRTWREMAGDTAIALCLLLLAGFAAWILRRDYQRRKRRRVLDRYVESALMVSEPTRPDESGLMWRFCREVGAGYGDSALRAEDLARNLGMGRNELRREVKAAVGVSLEDFVRMVRVRAASALLAEGKLNVAETAYKCGFKTPQYMAMVFKEQTGHTPSEYAVRHRKKM